MDSGELDKQQLLQQYNDEYADTTKKPILLGKVNESERPFSEGGEPIQVVQEVEDQPILRKHGSLGTQGAMRASMIEASTNKAISETENPIKLTWHNLCYRVKVKAPLPDNKKHFEMKEILKDCSGVALPGQTLYIMGASGAGKTSLMNALSDRIADNQNTLLTGDRLLNDTVPLTSKLFGSLAVYVMQDDVIFKSFTVREALTFAARLRLKCSEQEQDKKIAELIQKLGLSRVQDTLVGDPLQKTISGGERKRTSIGVELITDPSVILLDEPTSGLDSFMARGICKILQDLAHKQGKTIISTIHQPSSDAFMHFDRLLLMCDGHTVYQGLAKDSPHYFRQMGFRIEGLCNPCDRFMEILSVNYPKTQIDEQKIEKLREKYVVELKPKINEQMRMHELKADHLKTRKIQKAAFPVQFKTLLWRVRTFAIREPIVAKGRVGMTVFMSLLMNFVFWQVADPNGTTGFIPDQSQVQNTIGAMFMLCMSTFMSTVFPNVLTFQLERPVFLREQANMMYDVLPYYMTRVMIEMPLMLIQPMIMCLLTYFSVNFRHGAEQFFMQWFALEMLVQCGSSLGLTISSFAENLVVAQTIAPAFIMPIALFGGLMVNTSTVFKALAWIQWISPIRYTLECLCIVQWENTWQGQAIYQKGLGFDSLGYWTCLAVMLGLVVALRIASIFALKYSIKKFQ